MKLQINLIVYQHLLNINLQSPVQVKCMDGRLEID
jgi:hypothetical protein